MLGIGYTMPPKQSSPSRQYLRAHAFLRAVIAVVTVYGLGMVLSGRVFAMTLFDALRFGPNTHNLDPDGVDYAIFAFGVLGSIIVGWMALMWFVVRLAASNDGSIRALARRALATSTAVWFVLDTGFSLLTDEVEHAAFNVPFVTLIATPLYIMGNNDHVGEDVKSL